MCAHFQKGTGWSQSRGVGGGGRGSKSKAYQEHYSTLTWAPATYVAEGLHSRKHSTQNCTSDVIIL